MATVPPKPDPFDDVREAFSGLGTSEKAAFVLEATFETIGQALAETGRRAATVLDDLDIDSWFTAEDFDAPPPPPAAPPPPSGPPPPKKTAGKPKASRPKAPKPPEPGDDPDDGTA